MTYRQNPCMVQINYNRWCMGLASFKKSAMVSKSASLRPREVMAGAPMRTPPGARALTSPTTAFLLSVMCTRSHAFSILLPFTPCQPTDNC